MSVKVPQFVSVERLKLNEAVFNWCLSKAKKNLDRNRLESSLRWYHLGANLASKFGIGELYSTQLENGLLDIAKKLPNDSNDQRIHSTGDTGRQEHWLHILSAALPVGGHTALLERWIELEGSKIHSIALTFQDQTPASKLLDIVKSTGGSTHYLGKGWVNDSLIDRAKKLRELSRSNVDHIVIHTHPWDVVTSVALGVPGGPSVSLLNHADHAFWVGRCVADQIINIRDSGEFFSIKYRAADTNARLPIPLPVPKDNSGGHGIVSCQKDRAKVRSELEIPLDAVVLLTIGSSYKYEPIPGHDFISLVYHVLNKYKNVYLIAIGPSLDDVGWKSASERSNGKIIPLGSKTFLSRYHNASDIYLEGFPFGSLTALLESGLSGLPCILAPQSCPLPYRSDDISLKSLVAPFDVKEYSDKIIEFISNKDKLKEVGSATSHEIYSHHCGKSWISWLRILEENLPKKHQVYYRYKSEKLSLDERKYWETFLARTTKVDPLGFAYREAVKLGFFPKVDLALLEAARRVKRNRGVDVFGWYDVFQCIVNRCYSYLETKILWRLR